MKDHFNKEIELLKNNQAVILEMMQSINQIKNLMESMTNRLEYLEDRFLGNENKSYHLENQGEHGEKMLRGHEQNFQEILDKMKRSNLQFNRIDQGIEIKTKECTKFSMKSYQKIAET